MPETEKKTRRGNHEWSKPVQKSTGQWVSKIMIGFKDNGKKAYKYATGKTKQECLKKQKGISLQSDGDGITRMPLLRALQWYYSPQQYPSLKDTSRLRIEQTLRNQFDAGKFIFLATRVEKVTHGEVQAFISELGKTLSYSSTKKAYDLINSFYSHYCGCNVLQYNPCYGVRIPTQKPPKKVEAFSREEWARIEEIAKKDYVAGSKTYRLGWAVVLLGYTGLRRGELLGLKWDHVAKDFSSIDVTEQLTEVNGRITAGQNLKTDSGKRHIPLFPQAKEALRHLYTIKNSEFVVSNQKGGPVYPSTFFRMFQNICKEAGVEPKGLHAIRHTFATRLTEDGMNTNFISKLLGHSSPSITADIYINLNDKEIEAEVKRFAESRR